jgi:hypothetical protein
MCAFVRLIAKLFTNWSDTTPNAADTPSSLQQSAELTDRDAFKRCFKNVRVHLKRVSLKSHPKGRDWLANPRPLTPSPALLNAGLSLRRSTSPCHDSDSTRSESELSSGPPPAECLVKSWKGPKPKIRCLNYRAT